MPLVRFDASCRSAGRLACGGWRVRLHILTKRVIALSVGGHSPRSSSAPVSLCRRTTSRRSSRCCRQVGTGSSTTLPFWTASAENCRRCGNRCVSAPSQRSTRTRPGAYRWTRSSHGSTRAGTRRCWRGRSRWRTPGRSLWIALKGRGTRPRTCSDKQSSSGSTLRSRWPLKTTQPSWTTWPTSGTSNPSYRTADLGVESHVERHPLL
mmetsp:Transcript_24540/g.53132  ORF Transcript_24540/g.53132 Transcript_24540/m.53132 type:complete len:208 (-) Transcript_24540:40-663(-)